MLLRRKTIIFPVRIITFIFNILAYASLVHITSAVDQGNYQKWPFVYAVLGLVCLVAMMIFLLVVSNYKRFQVDDPHYYVLVEQMVNKKWYVKNNLLFNLLNRLIIIISFVVSFKNPKIAGLIMLFSQFAYTIYFLIVIRFRKIRYFAFILISNILTCLIILSIFIGSTSDISSQLWNIMSSIFQILYYILIGFFFLGTMFQIVANKQRIVKQMKSIYVRFIRCDGDKQIIVSRFDQNVNHQKVTEFHTNLLYKKEISKKEVELVIISQ